MSGFAPNPDHLVRIPMREHLPSQVRSCDKVEVTRVVFTRGCGSGAGDVMREVTAWFTGDGHLIAEIDPFTTTD